MEHHLRLLRAFGIALVALGSAGFVARLGEGAPPSVEVPLTGVAVAILFTLLAVAGAVASRGVRARERLGLGRGRLGVFALALLVLGTLATSFGVDSALRALELRQTGALARFDRAVEGARGPSLAAAVLALALAPAFAEELFFRGWLQRGLATRMRPAWAVVVAALAFAVAHGDRVHASAAFLLGLYLGAAAQLAASSRAPILCHAVNNLTAVAVGATDLGVRALPATLVPAAFGVAILALWGARRAGGSGGRSVPLGHARGEQVPHPEEEGEEEKP